MFVNVKKKLLNNVKKNMKKAIYLILIIIISIPALSNTGNFEQKFKQANDLFAKSKFNDALSLYQEIINEDYVSADLFYNTANTYYRLNKVGESIYYYEKALQLSPDNEDYRYNLDLVNLRVKSKPAILPTNAIVSLFNEVVFIFSATFWAYVSIILFIVFLFVFFKYIKSQASKSKKIYFLASMIILFIFLLAMFFMQYQTSVINSHSQAIIIVKEIDAKSSPDDNASVLFPIYEGYKVEIENTSNGWCEIKLTDGKKAWIKKDVLKRL